MNTLLAVCLGALGGFVGGTVAVMFFYKIFWDPLIVEKYNLPLKKKKQPRTRRKYTDIR